jgi:hypothetical protein
VSRKIKKALLSGKFSNLCFKGLARKFSISLFVDKETRKFDFDIGSLPAKIQITLLDRRRLTNF